MPRAKAAPTYEQCIRCPRCGEDGLARVEARKEMPLDDLSDRLIKVFCPVPGCAYYGRAWYFVVNPANQVIYHTHTPYTGN